MITSENKVKTSIENIQMTIGDRIEMNLGEIARRTVCVILFPQFRSLQHLK